jgi:hypothetical protein
MMLGYFYIQYRYRIGLVTIIDELVRLIEKCDTIFSFKDITYICNPIIAQLVEHWTVMVKRRYPGVVSSILTVRITIF